MRKISKITLAVVVLFVPIAILINLPRERQSSAHSSNVTGNLGGLQVAIPSHFADLLEYSSTSSNGFFGPFSKHFASEKKIKSFGFYVRFPDMLGQSSLELFRDKINSSTYTTKWISVGINSAENYYGPGSLDRVANGRLSNGDPRIIGRPKYIQESEKTFGLEKFSLFGLDPENNIPYRNDRDAEDVFIHRNSAGKIDALIICSNRPHEAAPCSHRFTLEPKMNANVYVLYRRGMLENWVEIQNSVQNLILSFSV